MDSMGKPGIGAGGIVVVVWLVVIVLVVPLVDVEVIVDVTVAVDVIVEVATSSGPYLRIRP